MLGSICRCRCSVRFLTISFGSSRFYLKALEGCLGAEMESTYSFDLLAPPRTVLSPRAAPLAWLPTSTERLLARKPILRVSGTLDERPSERWRSDNRSAQKFGYQHRRRGCDGCSGKGEFVYLCADLASPTGWMATRYASRAIGSVFSGASEIEKS